LEKGVFVFHNDPELPVALRPHLPKARLIHLFHNCNRSKDPWRARFSESVDAAFGVSAACARWNETYFGCAVQVLKNGVDCKRFVPIPKKHPRFPVLGFAGRTDRQKAPDLLLRAALKLSEEGNQFSVQLIGSRFYGSHEIDSYQELLDQLCQRLQGRGILVERPGFVSRYALPRVLAKADIHVVPSRWEDPCPLTVMEGMATGQAVVGAACGGIPEIIARLGALLRNQELRESYGCRARERAERRTWSEVYLELREAIGN
jgi:glycosyltransferase involved in cell wall biosynthesis